MIKEKREVNMKKYICSFWEYIPHKNKRHYVRNYKIIAKNKKEVMEKIQQDFIIENKKDIWIN